jgi:hypothetical protein
MKRAALGGLWLLGCSEVVPPAPVDATPAADVVDGAVLDADASDGSPPDGSPSFCVSDAVCESGRRCCASRCVDPMSNAAHCGACGVSCAAGDHAAAACEGGVCRARCDVGYADCDGDRSNGCEAELATSGQHCGRCGNDCGAEMGVALPCAAGACARAACGSPLRGDCDGDGANGCEADLAGDPSNCGACGRACDAATICAGGACGVPMTASCADLHRIVRTLPTGVYRIDADGLGPREPFAVYCDMEADGGGWTYGAVVRTTTPSMDRTRVAGVTPFGAPASLWMDSEHSVDLTGLRFREVRIDNFTDRRSVRRAAATTLTWDADTYRSDGGFAAKRVALAGGEELRLGYAAAGTCEASRVNLPMCFTAALVSAGSVCDTGSGAFEGWAGAASSALCGMPACGVLFRDATCATYAARVAVYGFALR